MIFRNTLILLLICSCGFATAQQDTTHGVADVTYVVKDQGSSVGPISKEQLIRLEESVVLSYKDGGLQAIPSGTSILGAKRLSQQRVLEMRDLSNQIPNLHIPDYGSKITSAIYIRGVGSRVGSSAIGLYVDNAPFLDKSAYDFDLFDIRRIEILRGPQGTLYGRNSMGGLINIYTLSPWDFQGSRAKISSGSYGLVQAQVSHYGKLSESVRFNLGLNLRASDGYFKNTNSKAEKSHMFNFGSLVFPDAYKKETVGATQSASLRLGLEWRPQHNWQVSYKANYEYSDQDGYAYGRYDTLTQLAGTIDYNDLNTYKRNLLNQSLRLNYTAQHFTLSAVSSHQMMNDEMNLDQDFTAASNFTLLQKQTLNTVNQEIVMRSNNTKRFESLVGVSGFGLNLNTLAPVTFREDGVQNILQSEFPSYIRITDKELYFPGDFTEKAFGAAIFTQVRWLNVGIKGLSLTGGVRWEYEKSDLDYFANAKMNILVNMPPRPPMTMTGDTSVVDQLTLSYTQLLPKFALQYEWNRHQVFASVSKGYKGGGYNIQMFSDLMQTALKATLNSRAPAGVPVEEAVVYRPELSWNFELGSRFSFFQNRLNLSANLFYLKITDQQIVEFAPQGQGRMIKNAGKSHSQGIELSAQAQVTPQLMLGLSYGYTKNVFDDYSITDKKGQLVDYKDHKVPYSPGNTLAFSADYAIKINSSYLDQINLGAQVSGAGRIYWTEENDVYQNFYQVINARVAFKKNDIEFALWGRNLGDKSYNTFYFKTFGNAFGQLAKPLTVGADLLFVF